MALPIYGPQPGYITAAVVGTVLVIIVVALIDGLLSHRAWLWWGVGGLGTALPRLDRARAVLALDDQASRLRRLTRDRRTMRRAGTWALANWLFDAAALWMFLLAFGITASPATVILVFALANVAALLPLTPGGLGIVEITMTAMFTRFGMPLVPTTLGVAAYRICNYWLPIPLSAFSYLAIRRLGTGAPASHETGDPSPAAPSVTVPS